MKTDKKKMQTSSQNRTVIKRSEVGVLETGRNLDVEESRISHVEKPQQKMTHKQKEVLKIFSEYAEKPYLAEASGSDEKTQELTGSASTYVTHSQVGRLTVNHYHGKQSKNRAYFVKYEQGKEERKRPKLKQEKAPVIFCFTPFAAVEEIYRPLVKAFNTVYIVNLPKIEINEADPISMKDVKHFIDAVKQEMKSIQKKGPYFLWGCSWSGSLAYALASELKKQDADVTLALMDSLPYEQIKTLSHEGWSQQLTTSIHEIFDYYQLPKFVAETVRHKKNPHATFDDLIQRANQQAKASLSKERQRKKKEACLFALENLLSAFVLTHVMQPKRLKGSSQPKPFILYHSENAPMTSAQSASSSTIPCYGVQLSDYQRENIATTNHFSMLKNKDFITSLKGHFPYPLHDDRLFLFQRPLENEFKNATLWRYLIEKHAPIEKYYVEQTFKIYDSEKKHVSKNNQEPQSEPLPEATKENKNVISNTAAPQGWGNLEMLFPSLAQTLSQCFGMLSNRISSQQTLNDIFLKLGSSSSSTKSNRDDLNNPVPQQTFTIRDLFLPRKRANQSTDELFYPRKVLICAPPGSGKTTLLEKLKHQWSKTHLKEMRENLSHDGFELLIPIKLRKLNVKAKAPINIEKLSSLVILESSDFSQMMVGEQPLETLLEEVIKNNANNIVFVLDGLNELENSEGNHEFINAILTNPNYYVIATSTELKDKSQYDLVLELEPFSQTKTHEFVESFYQDKDDAQAKTDFVIETLVQNAQMRQLATVPLQLELICYYYAHSSRQEQTHYANQPLSQTLLFKGICEKLWEKFGNKYFPNDEGYLSTKQENDDKLVKLRNRVKSYCHHVSFLRERDETGSPQTDRVHEERITKELTEEAAILLGRDYETNYYLDWITKFSHFLTTDYNKEHKVIGYQFRHQMFQHFFTAEYLANILIYHPKDEDVNHQVNVFIQKSKLNPKFHTTLGFVAGLFKATRQIRQLNDYFNRLLKEPHDLRNLTQITLLIKCYEECLPIEKGVLTCESLIQSRIIHRIQVIIRDDNKEDFKYVFSVLKQCYYVSRHCLEQYLLPWFTECLENATGANTMQLGMMALAALSQHLTSKEKLTIAKSIVGVLLRSTDKQPLSNSLFAFKEMVNQMDEKTLRKIIDFVQSEQKKALIDKRGVFLDIYGILSQETRHFNALQALIIVELMSILEKSSLTTLHEKALATLKQGFQYTHSAQCMDYFNKAIDVLNDSKRDYFDSLAAVHGINALLPTMNVAEKKQGIECLLTLLKKTPYLWLREKVIVTLGDLSEVIAETDLIGETRSALMDVYQPYMNKAIITLDQLSQFAKEKREFQKIATSLVEFFLVHSKSRSEKNAIANVLGKMKPRLTQNVARYLTLWNALSRLLQDNGVNSSTKEAVMIALDKLFQKNVTPLEFIQPIIEYLLNVLNKPEHDDVKRAAAITLTTLAASIDQNEEMEHITESLLAFLNRLPISQQKNVILALTRFAHDKQNENVIQRVLEKVMLNLKESGDEEDKTACLDYLSGICSSMNLSKPFIKTIISSLLDIVENKRDQDFNHLVWRGLAKLKHVYIENQKLLKRMVTLSGRLISNKKLDQKERMAIITLLGELVPMVSKSNRIFDDIITQSILLLRTSTNDDVLKAAVQTLNFFPFDILVKYECTEDNLEYYDVLRRKFMSPELFAYLIEKNNQLYLKTPQSKILIDEKHSVLANILLRAASVFGHLGHVRFLLKYPIVLEAINLRDIHGGTPLHYACYHGYFEIVQSLVAHQANVNAMTTRCMTALSYACEEGHLEIAEYLVNHGAIIHLWDKDGLTLFYRASFNGRMNIVEWLEDQAVDIYAKKKGGWSPIHAACLNGHVEVLDFLVKKNIDVNEISENGVTPLHEACKNGHLRVAQKLIEAEAIVNIPNSDNKTALYLACEKGYLEVVKLLVDNHAEMNVVAKDGLTLLAIACFNGHLACVEFLVKRGANLTDAIDLNYDPLLMASQQGYLEIVQFLVQQGADVNKPKHNGWTGLHLACQYGRFEVVRFLCEVMKMDVEVTEDSGKTALHWASCKGHLDIVKYLCEIQNAKVNVYSKRNETPLYGACVNGHLEVVKYLCEEKKLNILEEDIQKLTPIGLACFSEHIVIIQYFWKELKPSVDLLNQQPITLLQTACMTNNLKLIKYVHEVLKLNVNQVNNFDTPLFFAVSNGHLLVVKYLIKQGANPNRMNLSGQTPIHVACSRGYFEVAQFLVEQGADFDLEDPDGYKPLHWACQQGNLAFLKFLVSCNVDVNGASNDAYGNTPLHWATHNNHLSVVKFLVSEGANVNAPNKHGVPPLFSACRDGYLDIVEFLVAQNADVNHIVNVATIPFTPFLFACYSGQLDVVKFMIANCAAIDVKSQFGGMFFALVREHHTIVDFLLKTDGINKISNAGLTLLHYACQNKQLKMAQLLVEEGFDVNAKNEDRVTPLHLSCMKGNLDIVDFLVQNGADVNAAHNEGGTPLHAASMSGHYEVAKLLLAHNANVNVQDKKGITPLHVACVYGDLRVVQLLIESGADFYAIDDIYNDMALSLASGCKHLDVVHYLCDVQKAYSLNTVTCLLAKGYVKLKTLDNQEAKENLSDAIRLFQNLITNDKESYLIFCLLNKIATHYLFEKLDSEKTIYYYELALKIVLPNDFSYLSTKQGALQNLACCYHSRAVGDPSMYEEQMEKANQCFLEAMSIKKKAGLICEYGGFLTNRASRASHDSMSLREEAIKYLLEAKRTQDDSGLSYTKLEYETLDRGLQQYIDEHGEIKSLKPSCYAFYLLIVNYLKLDNLSLAEEMYSAFQGALQRVTENNEIAQYLLMRSGEYLEEYQFNQAMMLSLANDENADTTSRTDSCEASTSSSSAYPFFEPKSESRTAQGNVSTDTIMQQYHQWQAFVQANSNEPQEERNLYRTELYRLYNDGNNSLFTAIEFFITTHVDDGLRHYAVKAIQNDEQLKQCINTLIENQRPLILSTDKGNKKIKSLLHYIHLMEKEGTCGTAFEIMTLAKNLQRPIAILTPGNQNDIIFEEPAYQGNQPIFLNYVSENRYQPLLVPEGIEAQTILQTIREAITKRQEQPSTLSATSSTMKQDT